MKFWQLRNYYHIEQSIGWIFFISKYGLNYIAFSDWTNDDEYVKLRAFFDKIYFLENVIASILSHRYT